MPFASRPHAAAVDARRGYLDPQVRLNLEVGGAMSLHADGWDVYAAYTIVDRAELDKPETTLPILDGGLRSATDRDRSRIPLRPEALKRYGSGVEVHLVPCLSDNYAYLLHQPGSKESPSWSTRATRRRCFRRCRS